MQLTVTQNHCECGCRKSAHSCPVALALQDTIWSGRVWVGSDTVNCGGVRYALPPQLISAIRAYDGGADAIEIRGTWDLELI